MVEVGVFFSWNDRIEKLILSIFVNGDNQCVMTGREEVKDWYVNSFFYNVFYIPNISIMVTE